MNTPRAIGFALAGSALSLFWVIARRIQAIADVLGDILEVLAP